MVPAARSLLRVLRGVAASVPDFALGAAFLVTWASPFTFGEQSVRYFMYFMLLEFIVIHSSAVLGALTVSQRSRTQKALWFLGLVLFYSTFAGAFSVACGDAWPLLAFWSLTLVKAPGLIFSSYSPESKRSMMRQWGTMAIFYVGFAAVTTLLPLPRLGINEDVITRQGFRASGLWIEQPYRVVAFGFLYFSAIGIYQFVTHTRTRPPKRKRARDGPASFSLSLSSQTVSNPSTEDGSSVRPKGRSA